MRAASLPVLKALLLAEVRMRMRRPGTMVAVLALIGLSWAMVGDPSLGYTLVAIDETRVLYTSTCLALGGALMAGLLFGLAGFYLVRGRVSEEIRSGVAAVLAATPVGNTVFVLGRWLGSVVYLSALLLVFLATMLVLHLLRGTGPIQLGVYLQTFALLLLPVVFLTASLASLFESWPPLMGKGGDVLYFIFFLAQLSVPAVATAGHAGWAPALLVDFSGVSSAVQAFQSVVHSQHFSIGAASFNPALAPVVLPESLWSRELLLSRAGCALIGMLPLLLAVPLFHRYSPDRVRVASGGGARWSPLALANRWLRPLSAAVRPLFGLAARLPGVWGEALAVVALALVSSPAAIVAAAVLLAGGCVVEGTALGGWLTAGIVIWGVLVSELSVRDLRNDVDGMSAAAPGGAQRRFVAQLLAACLLALVFTAPVLLRWLIAEPLRAAALATGVFSMSCAASLLGRLSGGGRTFLALFLFGIYVAVQTAKAPALDVVGFNGAANALSVVGQLLTGTLVFVLALWHEKWRYARN
ncbi:ABC transporter permease [Duganella hordei]|uniref:ABC transporter permease n=1 Tax=Duganella hordei TaxID=2865934 RepID=UPI0030E9192C